VEKYVFFKLIAKSSFALAEGFILLASSRAISHSIFCFVAWLFFHTNNSVAGGAEIYWATAEAIGYNSGGQNGIYKADANGTGVSKIADSKYPFDLVIGKNGEGLFWTDNFGTISRSQIDGSNPQIIVNGLAKPWGIALDASHAKLYWTDATLGKIQRSNLDGTSVEDVLLGLSSPRELAIDPLNNKMYWAENYGGKIKRANLDGTASEVLLRGLTRGFGLDGLELDLVHGVMYLTESNRIISANLDGSSMKTCVYLTNSQPVSLAVDSLGGSLYWSDYTPDKIHRANLDGSGDVILMNALHPSGIFFVPEPSTLALLSMGGIGLIACGWRRRKAYMSLLIKKPTKRQR
jgi:sugar lactone lactonase YvrE